MKPRLRITFDFDDIASATTVYKQLSNELVGKDVFSLESFVLNESSFTCDTRFNKSSDRNLLFKFALSRTNNLAVTGFVISRHLCSHDDTVLTNCSTSQYELVLK